MKTDIITTNDLEQATRSGLPLFPGITFSAKGLLIEGDVPVDALLSVFAQLDTLELRSQWAKADLCNYGIKTHGKTYEEAMAATGLSYSTLANLRSAAAKVEFSRRRENLSVSHHVEVAALKPAEQTRFLDLAEENGWSVQDLRKAIRDERAPTSPGATVSPHGNKSGTTAPTTRTTAPTTGTTTRPKIVDASPIPVDLGTGKPLAAPSAPEPTAPPSEPTLFDSPTPAPAPPPTPAPIQAQEPSDADTKPTDADPTQDKDIATCPICCTLTARLGAYEGQVVEKLTGAGRIAVECYINGTPQTGVPQNLVAARPFMERQLRSLVAADKNLKARTQ